MSEANINGRYERSIKTFAFLCTDPMLFPLYFAFPYSTKDLK